MQKGVTATVVGAHNDVWESGREEEIKRIDIYMYLKYGPLVPSTTFQPWLCLCQWCAWPLLEHLCKEITRAHSA